MVYELAITTNGDTYRFRDDDGDGEGYWRSNKWAEDLVRRKFIGCAAFWMLRTRIEQQRRSAPHAPATL